MPPVRPAASRPTESARTPTRLQSRFTKDPFVGGRDTANQPPGDGGGHTVSTATSRAGHRSCPIEAVARSRSPTTLTTRWRSQDTMAQGEVDVKRRGLVVNLLTTVSRANRGKGGRPDERPPYL